MVVDTSQHGNTKKWPNVPHDEWCGDWEEGRLLWPCVCEPGEKPAIDCPHHGMVAASERERLQETDEPILRYDIKDGVKAVIELAKEGHRCVNYEFVSASGVSACAMCEELRKLRGDRPEE